MRHKPYQLAIFDFDGTLADTFPWFCSVINDVALRYRFRQIAPDETDELRGLSARALIRELGVSTWKLPFITRHMHDLAARDIDAITLFPGTSDMLRALDEAGIKLAIVSSNSEANVRHVLGPCAARFRHFACGASMFGKAKRLKAVMREAGSTGRVIYIGDELRDHDAARAAICDFGAVSWGYTRRDALAAAQPDLIFEHPSQIEAAIRPPHA